MVLVFNGLHYSSLLLSLRGGVFHVIGGAIYLSGIDMIHGTPVLDIKPYIAEYDSPQNLIEPLQDFNLQNTQHKHPHLSQSGGKPDSCDQQQLSRCDKPPPCSHPKEKLKCPENRSSGENYMKRDNSTKIRRNSPKHGERVGDLGVKSTSDQSPRVAEEQIGPYFLEKNFSEEDTARRLRRGKEAVIAPGSSAEVQRGALRCPPRRTAAACCSVVPAWVREAPVATLGVRFTPHAEMDLEHLSSGGEPDTFCPYFSVRALVKFGVSEGSHTAYLSGWLVIRNVGV